MLPKTLFPRHQSALILLILIFSSSTLYSQINAYAEISSISGLTLTVNSSDETFDTFQAGEQIIIMQMQDDVLGNTSNSSNFGNLGSINSAGLYEIRVIDFVVRGGSLTSIVLLDALTNSYNTGGNESVQAITFPTLDGGGGNYTTTSNISALGWNGTLGGVVAFNVDGILTLNHDIDADGDGFRGGAVNGGGSAGCTPNGNYRVTSQNDFADKGEGIYKATNTSYAAGRGKIINGGGGGNSHNAGGAGGGNYTAGGDGGPGWVCSPTAGGIGGIGLSADISASRVFMGGGGGAGEGNNGASQGGGDGGGIVLIKAAVLRTTGSCGSRDITALGESLTGNSSNDGSGGAGAGGSIILQVDSFSVVSSCDLIVDASGGQGGSVNSSAQHGGGGGGGQGVIVYSQAVPTTNVTNTANNGIGGCNDNSSPCTNQASNGSGTNGSGVIGNSTGPLPVTLIDFSADLSGDVVIIEWSTLSEINNDHFIVEKSTNLDRWKKVTRIEGAGNSREKLSYSTVDREKPNGTVYYRLHQVDHDGKRTIYKPVAVTGSDRQIHHVYPNPFNDVVFLNLPEQGGAKLSICVFDSKGQQLKSIVDNANGQNISLDLSNLAGGSYILQVKYTQKSEYIHILKK